MMRTPPLLLAATLLFWGWQTDLVIVGLIMGVVLECSRLVKRRLEFSTEEFTQLWTLTTLIFASTVAFSLATHEGATAFTGFFNANSYTERSQAMNKAAQAIMVFLQWLPMVFFLFVAAQAFSQQPTLPYRVFSVIARRRAAAGGKSAAGRGLNTAYPYFAITLFAVSTVNTTAWQFYTGLCLLLGWGLWAVRSPRFPLWAWLLTMLLSTGLGWVGIQGLQGLFHLVNDLQTQWLSGRGAKGFDSKETRTSMGQIGRLKGSGQIMLRLEIPNGDRTPSLLRQAVFDTYQAPSWRASTRQFHSVAMSNDTTWILLPGPARHAVQIAASIENGKGVLCLPTGTRRLEKLPVYPAETNTLGTLRVDLSPGLLVYQAHYDEQATFDGQPTAEDSLIPERELPVLRQVAAELGLADLSATEKIRKLQQYFTRHFDYGFWKEEDYLVRTNDTILSQFLLQRHHGHCEFFATATTLLLRQAGIPARYVVGYSVQEGAGGNRFVVRERHAHAWCLYYDAAAAQWRELDTTPGTWIEAERERRSWLEPLQDFWSRLRFEYARIRWGQSPLREYLGYAFVPLVLYLALRFIFRKRWRRQKNSAGATAVLTRQGLDSEFFLVEARLTTLGLSPLPGETPAAWMARVQKNLPPGAPISDECLRWHYRLRFDPAGLPPTEREQLKNEVRQWLQKMDAPRQDR